MEKEMKPTKVKTKKKKIDMLSQQEKKTEILVPSSQEMRKILNRQL
jgi:hypothetical protein